MEYGCEFFPEDPFSCCEDHSSQQLATVVSKHLNILICFWTISEHASYNYKFCVLSLIRLDSYPRNRIYNYDHA